MAKKDKKNRFKTFSLFEICSFVVAGVICVGVCIGGLLYFKLTQTQAKPPVENAGPLQITHK